MKFMFVWMDHRLLILAFFDTVELEHFKTLSLMRRILWLQGGFLFFQLLLSRFGDVSLWWSAQIENDFLRKYN